MKLNNKLIALLAFVAVIAICLLIYYPRPSSEQTPVIESREQEVKFEAKTIQQGHGAFAVKPGDKVAVNYIGMLENDTMFSSNLSSGAPYETFIGKGEAPLGWDEALIGMKVGEKRRITVPADYSGSGARGDAPEGVTLYYEVELVEIK
jgi:FKBP-type peptidyl-prolyl cis-trans isomerase